MGEDKNKVFQDRDIIQDVIGDIYQVIGSIHPVEGVMVLQKYKKINITESKVSHQKFIPNNDPISKIRSHIFMYWVQKETNDHFIRILQNYSSKSAQNNIQNNPNSQFSPIFNIK